MEFPDVTGFLLDQALQKLRQLNADIDIQIIETKSPKSQEEHDEGEVRVLKQTGDDQKMVLTVALF